MNRNLAFLLLLLATVLTGTVLRVMPAAAVAGCPLSTIYCNGTFSSTDEVRSETCPIPEVSNGFGSYDLVLGRFQAGGSGSDIGGGAGVVAVDDYSILGLPAGTPVSIVALFHARGSVSLGCGFGPSGDCAARLTEGTSNRVEVREFVSSGCGYEFCCGGGASVDSTLRLNVIATAGTPFRLTSDVGGGARFGSASMTAQLSFEGLPPGTWIASCQGFRQDAPVPALPASWGSVKARYR